MIGFSAQDWHDQASAAAQGGDLVAAEPKQFDRGDDRKGWLEVGRPPAGLGLDLEPLRYIKPKAGHLALFLSTLYHNTAPFEAAERLTVAFDVASEPR